MALNNGCGDSDNISPISDLNLNESPANINGHSNSVSSSGGEERYANVNPFERWALKHLKGTVISPSVFADVDMSSTPSNSSNGGFRGWDIHEVAELFPHPLESSPSSHTNPYPTDPSIEAKAQQDIHEFFGGAGPVIPTPDDVQAPRKKPRHQDQDDDDQIPEYTDSWANTELSLPPGDLPPELMEALKPYFNVECSSETTYHYKRPPRPLLPQLPLCSTSSSESPDEEEEFVEGEELMMMETSGVVGGTAKGSGLRKSRSLQLISVRRRLELSFGNSCPLTPIKREDAFGGDPLGDDHLKISPPKNHTPSKGGSCDNFDNDDDEDDDGMEVDPSMSFEFATPSTKCKMRHVRTPGAGGSSNGDFKSPDITPIRTGSQ